MNKRIIQFTMPLVIALMIFASLSARAQALSCGHIFLDNPLIYIRNETYAIHSQIVSAKQESQKIMNELRQRSTAKLAELKSTDKIIELDLLCIGGGPACISAAQAIPEAQRSKALIIEQTNEVAGTFNNADFFINTGVHTTDIPGAKTPFSTFANVKYPHSSQLAVYLQTALKESGVSTLLNTTVKDIQVIHNAQGTASVLLTTNNNIRLQVKNLLLGTGLGQGYTKVPEASYRQLFMEKYNAFKDRPDQYQEVMHSDSFLTASRNSSAVLPKRIFIFGNGDGARIVLESLSRRDLPADFKIIWIGAPYKNADEYIASQQGFDRYVQAIPSLYDRGHIIGIEGHVSAVTKSNGHFKVTVENKDQIKEVTENADMIIDATGYQSSNLLTDLQSKSGTKVSLQPITGNADNLNQTTLGNQVVLGNQSIPIYQIGVAAGPLVKENEKSQREVKNPAAIHNNAGRAFALVKEIFRKAKP